MEGPQTCMEQFPEEQVLREDDHRLRRSAYFQLSQRNFEFGSYDHGSPQLKQRYNIDRHLYRYSPSQAGTSTNATTSSPASRTAYASMRRAGTPSSLSPSPSISGSASLGRLDVSLSRFAGWGESPSIWPTDSRSIL